MSIDVLYEKIHHRHDSRWSYRLGLTDGKVSTLCVACVVEMIENSEVSSVRKSVALAGVGGVLKRCPGALKELLLQDERVCLHFTGSLLGMLHAVGDPATLEQVTQVLVQLLLELQSEQLVIFVLDEINTQLCGQSSVRGFLPTFIFLGKLVDAVPALPQTIATQHIPLLEQLSLALLCPDEALKSSVFYVFQRVWGSGEAGPSLSLSVRDRLCVQLLQTLSHARSPQLTVNGLGFLKQMLKLSDAVSVLMNCHADRDDLNNILRGADLDQGRDPQAHSQPSTERCCLPLVLKKLLLSGDEMLQVASAQCIAAVLVQSPGQYCPRFIQADVPEFLFERLCSQSEVLLWSVYSCLLLLTEDPLFFSQCHSVYGIEALIRSLKGALALNNPEVQRQGLLLLTEILERQPVEVGLFPSGPGFVGAVEVVLRGVSSPCLQVATQAACAATALLRLNHQSSPVQYKELKKLVETVSARCAELPLLPVTHRRATGTRARAEPSSQSSGAGAFLLQALGSFHSACRLAGQCAGEPGLAENVFTAPDRRSEATLDSFTGLLLQCCDTALIPCVTRQCERAPSAPVLQNFFTILSCQFSLLPLMMPPFSSKLASSGFFRLTLEHRAAFCSGDRNPALNAACSDFLQRLSVSLLAQLGNGTSTYEQDCEEAGSLLRRCLSTVCCRLSEWPSLLCEAPEPGREIAGLRAAQYGMLILLYLALWHEDRLLPDSTVFSCVATVLYSVQEQGNCPPPPCVLRAAFYLLSVTQDKSPDLDWAPLNCISKALSSSPSFPSLYTHHPALLQFVFHYPELVEQFGPGTLELWLSHGTRSEGGTEGHAPDPSKLDLNSDLLALVRLVETSPTSILTLLGFVCTREPQLASGALAVLEGFLRGRPRCDPAISGLLRPRLLQVLQRLAVESSEDGGALSPLPLVLQLLCQIQASASAEAEMDGTDFKLVYHVSNLAGKLKPSAVESLLPAFNYLYNYLALSPPHCTDRAASMLLCNGGLIDQLQALLSRFPSSLSSSPSSSPSPPPSSLLCCACLLLASLLWLRQTRPTQVQKPISLNLDRFVQLLAFRKGKTDSLLLASSLRLLQSALDVDLQSPLLALTDIPHAQRPLQDTEAALYPLGSHRAHCLVAALHGLLLRQKQELLLRASVNCLGSLLGFLHRRSPLTAVHLVCQPWSRFLLYSLLDSGESTLLHPAVLTLLALLVRHGNEGAVREQGVAQVLDAVDKKGVKELGSAAQALKRLLTQLESSGSLCSSEEHSRRTRTLLNTLSTLPTSDVPHQRILHVGQVSICLSDFAVNAEGS